jgi:Spy/CpxP family protein refolding chaperone
MKQQILRMTFGLALGAALMFGQGGGRRAGERFLENLNLTEEQKPKVQAIFKEQREAMQAARAKQQTTREEMKAILAQTHEKLKGVLTEEQLKKVDDARRKMGKRRRG